MPVLNTDDGVPMVKYAILIAKKCLTHKRSDLKVANVFLLLGVETIQEDGEGERLLKREYVSVPDEQVAFLVELATRSQYRYFDRIPLIDLGFRRNVIESDGIVGFRWTEAAAN